MNITVWSSFSKRKNSTKQPTAGTTISNVTLKEATSIENPTFVLSGNNFAIDYVQAFGNYYFVSDIKSIRNGITEVSCIMDEMATHKSEIAATSQYIERANTTGIIPRVPDNMNPPTDDIEIKTTDIINLGWAGNPTLILGVVSISGVAYYSVTQAQLNTLLGEVFDSSFIAQFTSQFYGLRECLISLKKVPYTPTGHSSTIHLGDQATSVTATRISDAIIGDSATVMINRPSDDHEAGTSYLDFSPYTIGAIYLPYVGVVPLDMEIIGDTRYVTVDYWLDQVTGDIAYKVSTNGKILGTYSGNCAASLPIAAQNYNAIGVGAGVLAAIGGIATGNPALVASGALGAFKECSLHSQVNGAISSFIGNSVGTMVQTCVVTRCPVDWDLDKNKTRCGLPVQKTMSISSLSGYIKCRNASVPLAGFDKARTEIENMMNSGFYYE